MPHYAQNSIPPLERNINLQVNNTSIELVLNKIANETGCKFSYSPAEIGSAALVSVNAKNKSVREVLNSAFSNKVKYKSRGNYIILQKKSAAELTASKKNVTVKGYVMDANSGQKIPNATIYDKISLGSATSDDYGYYEIKLKNDKALQLNINKQNYYDTIILIKQEPEELINVAIYPSKEDTSKMNKIISKVKKSAFDFFISTKQKVNSLNVLDTLARAWQVSFVPYLGSNLMMSGNVTNDYSLNIIGGYANGARLVEVGGVLNIDRKDVGKVQLAGFANVVGGDVNGLQMAGFTNLNNKGFNGLQCAGFLNMNKDSCKGAQLAGFLNVNKKNMKGLQAAGFANVNSESEKGVLLAGFINVNQGNYLGAQVAGMGNNHKGNLKGIQLAGAYNFDEGEINGVQLAGLFNYAKKVKGCQIGIINISDSCSGAPIGLFSFVKSGYHRIEVASDERFNYSVAFRSGSKRFYSIFNASSQISTLQGKSTLWTLGYGIGTSFKLNSWLDLNLDLIGNQYVSGSTISSNQNVGNLLLTLDVYPAKKFSLFLGPVFNVAVMDYTDTEFYNEVSNKLPASMYSENLSNTQQLRTWFGVKGGIRFL